MRETCMKATGKGFGKCWKKFSEKGWEGSGSADIFTDLKSLSGGDAVLPAQHPVKISDL